MICFILISTPSLVSAEECFNISSKKYNISKSVLVAIAKVESSLNPNATRQNRNGTEDIGIMQINSWWLKHLKKIGINRKALFDKCTNIDVGAWILYQEIIRHGYSWKAIGYYHSPTPYRQRLYIIKVAKHIKP